VSTLIDSMLRMSRNSGTIRFPEPFVCARLHCRVLACVGAVRKLMTAQEGETKSIAHFRHDEAESDT
jgi:hypothetical protein